MMDWNEMAAEVHENAVAHGWWDKEPTFGEIIALIHSEASEALEEFRAGKPLMYCRECDTDRCLMTAAECNPNECLACHQVHPGRFKPEGVAVELADCALRVLDFLGNEQVDVNARYRNEREYLRKRPRERDGTVGGFVAGIHNMISCAYREGVAERRATHEDVKTIHRNSRTQMLVAVLVDIIDWGEAHGMDMEDVMLVKRAYNLSRPYRHGGKAL